MEKLIKCLKILRIAQRVIIVSLSMFVLFLSLLILNKNKIVFNIADQSNVIYEYGSGKELAEVKAFYRGTIFNRKGTPLEVSVTGEVDYNKLGTYELTYSAKTNKEVKKVGVTVTVKDTQAPVITLVTNPDYYTNPKESYQEEGFTATDNYDGDITSSVVAEEKDGKVIYKVTDSSGNETVVERTIVYKDAVAPVLTLNGNQSISLYIGDGYSEAGFTASDDCDGDITANVVVEGSVNVQQAGTYTMIYKVTDSSGNTAEARRVVTVKKKIPATGEKVIYLTFDDGPCSYTEKLLDVLDRHNIKVTFFVTGANSSYYHLIGEAHRRGHTIAIHTYSHVYADIYSSVDAYLADFNKIKEIVVAQTGQEPWLFRFPGGTNNTVSKKHCTGIMTILAQEMVLRGYDYCDWNVSSADTGGGATEQTVINSVINGISGKNAAYVLQHDIRKFSVEAVEEIIEWGKNNGYVFKAIDRDTPLIKFNPAN